MTTVYRTQFHGFSGGEQAVVNLALRLALSQMIAVQMGTEGLGFIVLDEVFGSADTERRETIMETLNGLNNCILADNMHYAYRFRDGHAAEHGSGRDRRFYIEGYNVILIPSSVAISLYRLRIVTSVTPDTSATSLWVLRSSHKIDAI